jgi:hypothetical protein
VDDSESTAAFCVWVVVRDSDQAEAFAALPVAITHRDPQAALDVVRPDSADEPDHYPLYSTIQVSSDGSMDTENTEVPLVARTFSVTHAGHVSTPMPCPDRPDTDVCISASEPGDYTIDLIVTDARQHHASATRKLTVNPDAPPCITQTAPQFGLPKFVRDPNDLMLEVDAVTDDGDPYPFVAGAQNLEFEWSWWPEGSFEQRLVRPDHKHPQAEFNGVFHPGDQINIRVKVTDRVDRKLAFDACAPEAATCAVGSRKDCYQWVTWKFDLRLGREM